ncbi:MAG: right-handed parallel beta-helix repeat-containing protein [Planctomycetota bacterium]
MTSKHAPSPPFTPPTGEHPFWPEVWRYSIARYQAFLVSGPPGNKWKPDVFGDVVIWGDCRSGDWDIYGYSITADTEFPIATGPDYQRDAAIFGCKVVYENTVGPGKSSSIGIYDLLTAGQTHLPIPNKTAWLDIFDHLLVWGDCRDAPDSDIYAYNLLTGQEFPVSTEPLWQYSPAIYENTIVWSTDSSDSEPFAYYERDIDGTQLVPPPPALRHVPGQYPTIQAAIDNCEEGDTIVVAPGTFGGGIDFQGKDITLTSTDPDDPYVVANTIIDCKQSTRALTFKNGEHRHTVVNGFTIINGTSSGEGGGAIHIAFGSGPTIANVIINNCSTSNADGGAIYVGPNCRPSLKNCTITNCAAFEGSGGAVYCGTAGSLALTNCVFQDNFATYDGGAVYHDFSSASVLKNCTHNGNESACGGAICYSAGCKSQLQNCTFANNTAADSGGAVLYDIDNYARIADCNFENNSADYGGALYFDPGCSGIMTNTKLLHNNAAARGGAIYITESHVLSVTDCNISYNTATSGGGLYCLDSPAATITNCQIKYNRAYSPTAYGGGLFGFTGPGLIVACQISNNAATTAGGGLYLAGNNPQSLLRPTLKNCLITNNTADKHGAGVSCNWYVEAVLSNSTIAHNTLTDASSENNIGGGLHCSYGANVEVVDTIIWGNAGGWTGSQIAVTAGDLPYKVPSTLAVTYSDVEGWQDFGQPLFINPNAVFVDSGSALTWDFTTAIDDDPRFVAGYYLSHAAAGQDQDSPCIDAGSNEASTLGLEMYTTRTDGLPDTGPLDIGYHYGWHPKIGDFDRNWAVNFRDFAIFSQAWKTHPGDANWNPACDISDPGDGFIDEHDLALFAEHWLDRNLAPQH